MLQPERNQLQKEISKKVLANLIEKNPNHQSEASKKAHSEKDDLGRSLLAMRNYEKGLGLVDENGKNIYGVQNVKKLNEILFCDPDHPELGERSAGTLAKMQKSRGYPNNPENRVKVGTKGDE
jgi:hypothetical protein